MDSGDNRPPAPAGEVPSPDPRQIRLLKIIVSVLGVLIVLALAALVAGIVVKSARLAPSEGPQARIIPFMVEVPPDARVENMALDGDRLVVHLRRKDGSGELLVFNLRKKALTGRFELAPKAGR